MIRRMRESDLRLVTEMDGRIFGPEAWTLPEFEQEITGPDRLYMVWQGVDPRLGNGQQTPTVLGYAGVWTGGPAANLLTLAVRADVRHHGIGTALICSAAQAARLAGSRELRLEVRVDNFPAIRLYRRLGFVRVGYEPHYYQPEDVNAYVLSHSLRGEKREEDCEAGL